MTHVQCPICNQLVALADEADAIDCECCGIRLGFAAELPAVVPLAA